MQASRQAGNDQMKFEDEGATGQRGKPGRGMELTSYKARLRIPPSPQFLNSFHLTHLSALPFYRHNPGTLSRHAKDAYQTIPDANL